jgi:hypothetical protein
MCYKAQIVAVSEIKHIKSHSGLIWNATYNLYHLNTHTVGKLFCHRHLKNSKMLGKLPLQHGTLNVHRVALKILMSCTNLKL